MERKRKKLYKWESSVVNLSSLSEIKQHLVLMKSKSWLSHPFVFEENGDNKLFQDDKKLKYLVGGRFLGAPNVQLKLPESIKNETTEFLCAIHSISNCKWNLQ